MKIFIENMEKVLYLLLVMLRDGFIQAISIMTNFIHFCYDNILSSTVAYVVLFFVVIFIDAIVAGRIKDIGLSAIAHKILLFILSFGAWSLVFMYMYKIGSKTVNSWL